MEVDELHVAEKTPLLKTKYHRRLKEEQRELQEAVDKEKKLLVELQELEAILKEAGINPQPQTKNGKKSTGRQYLPHATYGELQLTCAQQKTYICVLQHQSSKYKHLLTVYQSGRFGCANHQAVGREIFERMSQKNLSADQALALRRTLCKESDASA